MTIKDFLVYVSNGRIPYQICGSFGVKDLPNDVDENYKEDFWWILSETKLNVMATIKREIYDIEVSELQPILKQALEGLMTVRMNSIPKVYLMIF